MVYGTVAVSFFLFAQIYRFKNNDPTQAYMSKDYLSSHINKYLIPDNTFERKNVLIFYSITTVLNFCKEIK